MLFEKLYKKKDEYDSKKKVKLEKLLHEISFQPKTNKNSKYKVEKTVIESSQRKKKTRTPAIIQELVLTPKKEISLASADIIGYVLSRCLFSQTLVDSFDNCLSIFVKSQKYNSLLATKARSGHDEHGETTNTPCRKSAPCSFTTSVFSSIGLSAVWSSHFGGDPSSPKRWIGRNRDLWISSNCPWHCGDASSLSKWVHRVHACVYFHAWLWMEQGRSTILLGWIPMIIPILPITSWNSWTCWQLQEWVCMTLKYKIYTYSHIHMQIFQTHSQKHTHSYYLLTVISVLVGSYSS